MQRTQSAEYRDAMRNQIVTIVPIRSAGGAASVISASLVGRAWLGAVGKHRLGPEKSRGPVDDVPSWRIRLLTLPASRILPTAPARSGQEG